MNFSEKVIVISGAAKGIGKATALEFANLGGKVAIFDKDQDAVLEIKNELEKLSSNFLVNNVDITNLNEVERFLSRVREKFGNIDVLVNNAGFGFTKKFEQTSPQEFDAVLNTNFKGAFFLTQKALPILNNRASIIFITSIHAEHPSLDPTYDSSKAAINSFVTNLALQLSSREIRVNAIAPGHIDVNTESSPRDQEGVPLYKKAGFPKDIANACVFLADNERARYITGTILPVTGGLHIPIAKDLKF
ncbi:MAG: Short-chain dehydrogenase/reductase SDR [Candidatus Daviesbacteria bacterium GW2011_GWA2_38_24]|uniref:Short-chain dehydrogenase/reductase SDR n=1 Tax=Candidatus Daviesbacteria bacterium GW2011_GWA2_38_24 TaxID=1618422 RepID=A0A0G0JJR2_9BACT|nr:MAG: Short-chain dehydrogenase/reductase SDR [Candidatus Daviesbacteria bacterium GW2011_GWA2_38_24]OGE22878.1 MAG: hypothetical protein A2688_04575 [Candidatus Daviesbacteria bacterium RIFCSPHIGHO2_01_FULL_38_8]